MSGAKRDTSRSAAEPETSREVTRPELDHQEPKELPFREGTLDRIVERAEAEPTPEEVAATAADGRPRATGKEPGHDG